MQKTRLSGAKGIAAAAVLAAAVSIFPAKASAGAIPKSGASTFLNNSPGLSLAPRTLVVGKNAADSGWSAFFNTPVSKGAGAHIGIVKIPGGPAIRMAGAAVGSEKTDLGFEITDIGGRFTVKVGGTVRATKTLELNALVSSRQDGKLEYAINSNASCTDWLGVSVKKTNDSVALGADANVFGFLPSASVALGGKKMKIDADVWSPKLDSGGKIRLSAGASDIGGETQVKLGVRIGL